MGTKTVSDCSLWAWVWRFEFADTVHDCAQPPRQCSQLGFVPTPVGSTHKIVDLAHGRKQAE